MAESKEVNPAEVSLFISALRSEDTSRWKGLTSADSAFPIVTEIFMNGNCGNLALMLHLAFGAQPVQIDSMHHIASLIKGRLYDIRGDITEVYQAFSKTPMTLDELMKSDMVNNYSFAERGPLL